MLNCLYLNKSFCAGDRLISVNSMSLEGVSHHAALEILENVPEDVTLVISQPKLSKGILKYPYIYNTNSVLSLPFIKGVINFHPPP